MPSTILSLARRRSDALGISSSSSIDRTAIFLRRCYPDPDHHLKWKDSPKGSRACIYRPTYTTNTALVYWYCVCPFAPHMTETVLAIYPQNPQKYSLNCRSRTTIFFYSIIIFVLLFTYNFFLSVLVVNVLNVMKYIDLPISF